MKMKKILWVFKNLKKGWLQIWLLPWINPEVLLFCMNTILTLTDKETCVLHRYNEYFTSISHCLANWTSLNCYFYIIYILLKIIKDLICIWQIVQSMWLQFQVLLWKLPFSVLIFEDLEFCQQIKFCDCRKQWESLNWLKWHKLNTCENT